MTGPNAAHVNTVLGAAGGRGRRRRGRLRSRRRVGHAPFVVVVRPNVPVKPLTLFVNKAEIRGDASR